MLTAEDDELLHTVAGHASRLTEPQPQTVPIGAAVAATTYSDEEPMEVDEYNVLLGASLSIMLRVHGNGPISPLVMMVGN